MFNSSNCDYPESVVLESAITWFDRRFKNHWLRIRI